MTSSDPQQNPEATQSSSNWLMRAFNALRGWFGRNKWAGTVLTALMIIIPVYYLGRSLWENWQTLTAADIEIDWSRMALSLAILMAAFALFPTGTMIGLRGLGARVTFGQAYYGYHASQLGKYIPGRIWIIPGRAMTMRRFGVDAVTAASSTLIDMYVLIVAGVLVYIPALLVTEQETMRQLGLVGLLFCIPLLISIFFPSIMNKLFALGMKWIGRGEMTFHFAWYHFALMLVNDLALWGISGFGLYLLADSFSPLTLTQLPVVIGTMGFSWVLGTLAFLTPAGLGVREGADGGIAFGDPTCATASSGGDFGAVLVVIGGLWLNRSGFFSVWLVGEEGLSNSL